MQANESMVFIPWSSSSRAGVRHGRLLPHQHAIDVADLHLLDARGDVLAFCGGPALSPGVQEGLHRWLHHLQP